MPGLISAALGLSGGYSSGSQSQKSASTVTPTYTPAQGGLQQSLADALTAILQGTGYSPQVQNLQTQSADQINQNYRGLSDRLNQQFASRGFGQSGLSGGAQLQTELGRQGALASNNANFSDLALKQWNTGLSDALKFAFENPGSSTTSTGSASGSSWGIGVGGGFGYTGRLPSA